VVVPDKHHDVAQKFHRDSEDWKYLRFLICLTDVDDECGPHVYVKGSHRDNLPLRLKVYPPEEISQWYGNENVIKILGKLGTAIAADTSGIHKGNCRREQRERSEGKEKNDYGSDND
jgi:hypothetical protein